MSELADRLARVCWFYLLLLMRRPWMKGLQLAWLERLPEDKRESARISLARQNRFARRHGQLLLSASFQLLFGSILITCVYYLAVATLSLEMFNMPIVRTR